MKNGNKLREWATPFTIGAFVLSAVTGIMLFFRVNLGLVKPVHEWLSWLLVIGTVFHVIANWRLCVTYISKPLGRIILAVFFLIVCVSLIPINTRHGGHLPPVRISDVIVQASLASVAQFANHNPDEAIAMLRSKGMNVEDKEQTIGEISTKNGKTPSYVLDVIF